MKEEYMPEWARQHIDAVQADKCYIAVDLAIDPFLHGKDKFKTGTPEGEPLLNTNRKPDSFTHEDCQRAVEKAIQNRRKPDHNNVTNPSHYDLIPEKNVQAIDVIRAVLSREEFNGYCKGCSLKYNLRAGQKFNEAAEKDLSKARQYIDFCLEES